MIHPAYALIVLALALALASVGALAEPIPPAALEAIHEEVATPYKYGVVLPEQDGKKVDSPSVFRHGDAWYMLYIAFDGDGYETWLAKSDNLLDWIPQGRVLSFSEGTWDARQVAGYAALQDWTWGGSYELQQFDGKYWMSYLGGALTGYETEPLAIGMAWTNDPSKAEPWQRISENPVLQPSDADARPFERKTLYKSHIIQDPEKRLGAPFVMYYNAKQKGEVVESIGMAVSDDLRHWRRYGENHIVTADEGISGDPQITRINGIWVMFYFGTFGAGGHAFDTFAASEDLVHWTKWDGRLIEPSEPSEPWDKQYAHKPWVIKHDGVVYHYYCAVGDQGRVIALATSRPIKPADGVN